MTIKDILDGLRFTEGMVLFNPSTGEVRTREMLNTEDLATYDACVAAREFITNHTWISVKDHLPEEQGVYLVTTDGSQSDVIDIATYTDHWDKASEVLAWMYLPEQFVEEIEEEETAPTDLISQKQVLDIIESYCDADYPHIEKLLTGAIKEIPLRFQGQQTGKWIKKEDSNCYWYACSCCGESISRTTFGMDYFSAFCPNCGAKMDSSEISGDEDYFG